jgi:septum formation protein
VSEPLVLASASPRRRELLGLLGLAFEVEVSRFDEPSPETHSHPSDFAATLARGKAEEVARRRPGRLDIGADSLVFLGQRLLSKPSGPEDAARMLRELSGRTHQVITGVALVLHGAEEEVERCFHTVTEVRFRALTDAEIQAYVATGEPMDKAGAYGIQGFGGLLIEGIVGDYPNVVGLPVTPLALALRDLGYPVLGQGGGS